MSRPLAPLTAHSAPLGSGAGSQALCGCYITGQPAADSPLCPSCASLAAAPASGALLVTVTEHVHTWEDTGRVLVTRSTYSPLYRCSGCGCVVKDAATVRRLVVGLDDE